MVIVSACYHSYNEAWCIQVRMDGSDGHTDLRMCMPDNVGAFFRSSTKSDGTALCLGG